MEEYYHVDDDVAVLFKPDAISEDCCKRPGNTESRPRGMITTTGSEPTGTIRGYKSTVHYCHGRLPDKIDQTAIYQLITVSVLCSLLMLAQIIGGILSNSLALVTDATHMASDLASFLVSLLAIWLARKPPNHHMTLGYHRTEVLGALASILIIWIVTGVLVYVAAKRIYEDTVEIDASEMLIIAGMGVAFNITMGIVLHSGIFKTCQLPSSIGHNHSHNNNDHHGYHKSPDTNQSNAINGDPERRVVTRHPDRYGATADAEMETADIQMLASKDISINIKAATIHVLGDFIQSVGVLIAAVIIKVKPEYQIVDPICTFIFSVLVLLTTVSIFKDVIQVLLEAKPRGTDYHGIYTDLRHLDGVRSVHSLSLWSLTVNKTAAVVHIVIDEGVDPELTLERATEALHHGHGVYTSTVQIEKHTMLIAGCKQCQV